MVIYPWRRTCMVLSSVRTFLFSLLLKAHIVRRASWVALAKSVSSPSFASTSSLCHNSNKTYYV